MELWEVRCYSQKMEHQQMQFMDFLAILFKILEDIKPEYLVVAFDLKGPTKRHEMYVGISK